MADGRWVPAAMSGPERDDPSFPFEDYIHDGLYDEESPMELPVKDGLYQVLETAFDEPAPEDGQYLGSQAPIEPFLEPLMPGMPALSRLGPPGPAAIPAPGADASCGREPSMEYMIWGAGAVHDNSWPPQPLADADADRTDPSEIVLPPLHSSNRDSHDVFGEVVPAVQSPSPFLQPPPYSITSHLAVMPRPYGSVPGASGQASSRSQSSNGSSHSRGQASAGIDGADNRSQKSSQSVAGIPTSMLGLFSIRDGESTKRRHTTQSGREKAAKVRKTGSCLACYLGHKECDCGHPCGYCLNKRDQWPRCMGHTLPEKNIFLFGLSPSEQSRVRSFLADESWTLRADDFISEHYQRSTTLDAAIAELWSHKALRRDAYANLCADLSISRYPVFGNFYRASLVLQGRAVLLASEHFDFGDGDVAAAAALRALTGTHILEKLGDCLEKRTFKVVEKSANLMQNLVVFLAMMLEQTLSFEPLTYSDSPTDGGGSENGKSVATASTNQPPRSQLGCIQESLAYHLACELRHKVDKAFKGKGLRKEIHIGQNSVSLTDGFWDKLSQHYAQSETAPSELGTYVTSQDSQASSPPPRIMVRTPTTELSREAPGLLEDDNDAKSIMSSRTSHSSELNDQEVAELTEHFEKLSTSPLSPVLPAEQQRDSGPRQPRGGFAGMVKGVRDRLRH